MMDTRDPHAAATAIAQPDYKLRRNASIYYLLTYYLNLRYAERHGYEIIYYRMDEKECQHPLWGARHPSYCKLTAIAHTLALRRHRWVVWIDSDAFIRNVSLPLPALLRAYGAPAGDDEETAAYFGWDSPYTLGPNAGLAVLRSTEASTAMLQTWWNVYSGQYGVEHSYEQHTLQWQVMHLQAYRRKLHTLALRTMEPGTADAVVHLDHNAGTKTRLWTMAAAAARLLEGSSPEGISARKWQRALVSLRGASSEAIAPGRSLAAVVRALALDLTKRVARGAAAPRAFNPTDAGARLLGLPSRTRPEAHLRGMPLHLTNCTRSALLAPWQLWHATRSLAADPAADAPSGGVANSSGRTSLALAALPSLCLSLGETRAPKQPYSTLAQLARCAPRRRGGGGGTSAAAFRLALEHQPVSGLLQTTYRLRSLRRHVPELHPACGFWPNCTATRFVLPKQCWARLEDDLQACEDSEPVLQNLIRRGREVRMNDGQYLADAKPGWRRVAIGAAGPVPEAALTMAPSDRLCLTAWRSMFVEGAPATFVNCPKQRTRSARAAAKAAKTAEEATKAARAAEAKALKAGASAERAEAAGKRAAQLVERVREEKVRTLHEGRALARAHPHTLLHARAHAHTRAHTGAHPHTPAHPDTAPSTACLPPSPSPGEHAAPRGGLRRLVALLVGHRPRDRPRDRIAGGGGGGPRRCAARRAHRAPQRATHVPRRARGAARRGAGRRGGRGGRSAARRGRAARETGEQGGARQRRAREQARCQGRHTGRQRRWQARQGTDGARGWRQAREGKQRQRRQAEAVRRRKHE